MNRTLSAIRLLLLACWIGGGLFLVAIAAPAAFRNASRTDAANIVGTMLRTWHYMAIAVPLILLVLELRKINGGRSAAILLLTMILLFASAQTLVDLRTQTIRRISAVPIHSLSMRHPLRKQFGRLHAASSSLMLLQLLLGLGVVFLEARSDRQHQPPT